MSELGEDKKKHLVPPALLTRMEIQIERGLRTCPMPPDRSHRPRTRTRSFRSLVHIITVFPTLHSTLEAKTILTLDNPIWGLPQYMWLSQRIVWLGTRDPNGVWGLGALDYAGGRVTPTCQQFQPRSLLPT